MNTPKTWLTADWHLGEERFALMQRPFTTSEEYVNFLIQKHNELVSENDLVYMLGDVLYKQANVDDFLPVISKFNGHKILIRGNHDRHITDEQFSPYFEHIVEDGGGLIVELENIPCCLTHYPSLGKYDYFNIVGHIHAAWKFQLNALNVGVDVHHFYPVNAAQIPFFLKAITEFYDSDVWCAYADYNQKYYQSRGKKTSYFNATN